MADQATAPAPPVGDQTQEIKLLIEQTSTLNDAEKQYWLNLLPTMNEGQLNQLRGILQTEQKNLEEIDQKYDQKLEDVASKYLNQWDDKKAQEERSQRQEQEKALRTEDVERAENLLEGWDE